MAVLVDFLTFVLLAIGALDLVGAACLWWVRRRR